MRSIVAMLMGAMLLGFIGCGGDVGTRTAPTPVVPEAPAAPTNPTSIAQLAILNFTVKVIAPRQAGEWFAYQTRFRLAEVGAKSGATVVRVVATTEDSSDETGPGCWGEPLRVPAGGVLDVFDTGWEGLLYCAPGTASRSRDSTVRLTITFIDDSGTAGTVAAMGFP